ncbi:MAG: sulfatase [Acidobacteria bacterium]|nr:sulfatase [Acidobacteriota bacterium]
MIDRRSFLQSSVTTAAASASASAQGRSQPNVLFIATDDMSNALGCYGHPVVKTPHLDRLAARGVRFDRAYTQFALCSPSRTSLMTGLAPDTTHVYDLQKHFRTVLPDVVTMSQCFQKNGYYAARVGKIYHYGNPGQIGTDGLDDAPSWNHRVNPRGIDKDEEPKLAIHTPERKGLGSTIGFYSSPASDEKHTDGMVAEETIRLIEQRKDEPFFLAAGFYRPHCPYIAPSKYFEMYPADKMSPIPFAPGEDKIAPPWAYYTTPPNWNMTARQQQEALQAYYASISFVDANVGRLMAALERLHLLENTVVVFWSDHGYGTGEHGQWMKQTLFEAAARVPMIWAGPGVGARGKACGRTVELLDLYPTLTDLCGLASHVPANLHGRSLRPLLNSPVARWDKPALSQVQRQGSLMGHSIRTERYRFNEWGPKGAEGVELYDYQADPREVKNLGASAAQAGLREKLSAQLATVAAARGRKH